MEAVRQEKQLSTKRRCDLLGVPRSRLYYKKKPPPVDTELIRQMHEIYERNVFFGYRKLHAILVSRGYTCNRKKIERLACLEGLRAVCVKKRTRNTRPTCKHPYLLRNLAITHPNQVWQIDTTYIKFSPGFVYLHCLIDMFSRKVMGWNLSSFLETKACILATKKALCLAKPKIINSDQGCQFTSAA